jgi:glycosyltransferase involved in cell wall biosynthesis
MNVMILADFKVTAESKFWLKVELEKLLYNIEIRGIQNYNSKDDATNFGKIRIWLKYFKLAITGIKGTGKGDVIISDNFVIGAISAFVCKIFYINRKIIALNLIAHQKGFLNQVLRKFIYNIAFKYRGFRFSVNDEDLIGKYSEEFKFPAGRIFILHDAISTNYEQAGYNGSGEYVFTGGDAFRDWPGVIKCAEELPEIRFIGVARRKYFPQELMLPPNLKMYYDTSSSEFYSLLKGSRIVFLPLNSLAPCGLIVMMRAALLSKPVIITETPATKNYVENYISGRLIKINDVQEMKQAIISLCDSEDLRMKYTKNLKEYLLKNFSTEKNAKIISEMITAWQA